MKRKKYPKLSKKQLDELGELVAVGSGKEVRRAQAVLLLDRGLEIDGIIVIVKFKRRRIYELRKKYLKIGVAAIKDRTKGQAKELLTRKQKAEIIETVKTKKPSNCDDYFANHSYWTTGILGEYINREYGVKYKSKTSLYLIFRQSKFTYHKPGRVYQKHDERETRKWRKSAKVIVAKAWSEKNTVILSEDEMVLSTQTTFQKIWLPQGEYPKIEASNQKENRSIYGFLNIKTGTEHAFKTERQNMYITAQILKNIREIYPTQKIMLCWDGPGWHKGSEVTKFIAQDKHLEILPFPKYSPEENPQEHVWKKGRSNVTHNFTINDIDETTDEFVKYLNHAKFPYSLLDFSAVS